jgi:hypothetical protein
LFIHAHQIANAFIDCVSDGCQYACGRGGQQRSCGGRHAMIERQ